MKTIIGTGTPGLDGMAIEEKGNESVTPNWTDEEAEIIENIDQYYVLLKEVVREQKYLCCLKQDDDAYEKVEDSENKLNTVFTTNPIPGGKRVLFGSKALLYEFRDKSGAKKEKEPHTESSPENLKTSTHATNLTPASKEKPNNEGNSNKDQLKITAKAGDKKDQDTQPSPVDDETVEASTKAIDVKLGKKEEVSTVVSPGNQVQDQAQTQEPIKEISEEDKIEDLLEKLKQRRIKLRGKHNKEMKREKELRLARKKAEDKKSQYEAEMRLSRELLAETNEDNWQLSQQLESALKELKAKQRKYEKSSRFWDLTLLHRTEKKTRINELHILMMRNLQMKISLINQNMGRMHKDIKQYSSENN